LRIDYGILDQHADSYRKIRNTFRYLMGNLNDNLKILDLRNLKLDEFPELEQLMLHKIFILDTKIHNYLKSYDFHNMYKDLLNFCTVDLSAFYFDIRKDTLYCDQKNSQKRKSCIVLLNIILNSLLRWFAPILCFTTEEIYKLLSLEKKSIHLENFLDYPKSFNNENLNKKWTELSKIRDLCNISIEEKRAKKVIGSSLEASLEIKLNSKYKEILENLDLSELLIVSNVNLIFDERFDIQVEASKATGSKCPVCWKINLNPCPRHK